MIPKKKRSYMPRWSRFSSNSRRFIIRSHSRSSSSCSLLNCLNSRRRQRKQQHEMQ
jgi:hypothetical protein